MKKRRRRHPELRVWLGCAALIGLSVSSAPRALADPEAHDLSLVEAHELARVHVATATVYGEFNTESPADPTDTASKEQTRWGKKRDIPVGSVHFKRGSTSGELVELEVYDDAGVMRWEAVEAFSALMADGAMDVVWPASPRLLAMLYLVARDFDQPIVLISGVRAGDSQGHERRHLSGTAVDYYVEGISTSRLWAQATSTFLEAGVGYQTQSGMIHLDVRRVTLQWLDVSRPGQPGEEQVLSGDSMSADVVDATVESVHLPLSELYPQAESPELSELED